MTRERRRTRASTLVSAAVAALFAAGAAVLIGIVREDIRHEALREAEEKARLLLDRSLATHAYFSHQLKPAVFALNDRVMPPGHFDPVWMSSTYAVREIDREFHALNPGQYYYKECAVNARSPENEADPVERAFVGRLNRDPGLQVEAGERVIDGRSYYAVLRRGEAMEPACLRCHDTPARAPEGLVARYGPERSFGRQDGEVVSAVSIRIPLDAAYAAADRTTVRIAAALGAGLLGILGAVVLINRRLIFGPLSAVRGKAAEIAADERHLGEQIPLPAGRELADLSSSFNRMSAALRDHRDSLEQAVAERTAELRGSNEALRSALAEVRTLSGLIPICAACKKIRDDRGYWKQVESYVAEHTGATFSHGLCPDCLPEYFPESDRPDPPGPG